MSEGNVKIKQLKYKSGDLIAPYTPAHAVYTSSGTRLDYELGKIDVISAATDSSLSNFKTDMHNEMNEFEAESTNKFNSFSSATSSKIVAFSAETTTRFNEFSAETTNKFNEFSAETNTALNDLHESIETEINDLSGKTQESIGELYDATFPIQLSMSIVPSPTNNNNPSGHTVSLSVTQKSKGAFIPDNLELKKAVNGAEITIYSGKTASYTYTTNIECNIEKFTSRATKKGRTGANASQKRYICAYAANDSSSISNDDLFNGAIKKSTTSVAFNPSVKTELGQYIWIFVPSELNINKITNAGFNVTMEEPVTYTLSSGSYKGTYKAYRTKNALDSATWNFVIS